MPASSFKSVLYVCGIIAGAEALFKQGKNALQPVFGKIETESPRVPFDSTGYYTREMGTPLFRQFVSFEGLGRAEDLAEKKLLSIRLEEELRLKNGAAARVVNLDPGYVSGAALFMATTKDFAHRVPLRDGIYSHLELLFGKADVRYLDWTYPDFKTGAYDAFFLEIRRTYFEKLKLEESRFKCLEP